MVRGNRRIGGRAAALAAAWALACAGGCDGGSSPRATKPTEREPSGPAAEEVSVSKVQRTDEEWRRILTPEQYHILREKGTERAFTGKYWNTKNPGAYRCAGCGEVLFTSDSKFDSGCGWPSFDRVAADGKIEEHVDRSYGMVRMEVVCAKCGGHLGHVFEDGPTETGLRYCINSAAIEHTPKPKSEPASEPPGGK